MGVWTKEGSCAAMGEEERRASEKKADSAYEIGFKVVILLLLLSGVIRSFVTSDVPLDLLGVAAVGTLLTAINLQRRGELATREKALVAWSLPALIALLALMLQVAYR